MAAASHNASSRRKLFGRRRRVEDEGDDGLELDDDSLTEGSLGSDDHDIDEDSDTSNVDEHSPTAANLGRTTSKGVRKPTTKRSETVQPVQSLTTETDLMLNGLSISDKNAPVEELEFDEVEGAQTTQAAPETTVTRASAPIVVSSASISEPDAQVPVERRRREHDEYRKKRDEDPAFVPNRGAFFMHDHRHHGPAANGFRPYSRGGATRGRGRGGLFVPPQQQFQNPSDPLISSPWSHDMHEAIVSPSPTRPSRFVPHNQHQPQHHESFPTGAGVIPTCPQSSTPINRTMSTEKTIGRAQLRVFIPPMEKPVVAGVVMIKQYTKLPDHRPPLRRDKPVRISLPGCLPKYIFPASDRSFVFIPRAQRPNQQRLRSKGPRSAFGSIGGWSRRTSVFGGSYYNPSNYSPSVAMSRRSSLAPDLGREFLMSPTGSTISRPPMVVDNTRPVVRLPPQAQVHQQQQAAASMPATQVEGGQADLSSINNLPQPQTHPLPQRPAVQENRPNSIPMHQPRPQKAVSVENIEPPAQQAHYQHAFHQQFPLQGGNAQGPETHVRHPSYPSQISTGTPLSQIPERAIHAAPFQPNAYPPAQQGYYGQPYPMMPMAQQGYYYPAPYPGAAQANPGAPALVPGSQLSTQPGYSQQAQEPQASAQGAGTGANLVAQEAFGTVYYYDASQLAAVPGYPAYPATPSFAPGVMNMTPSQDGYYYAPPAAPTGMVYYPQ